MKKSLLTFLLLFTFSNAFATDSTAYIPVNIPDPFFLQALLNHSPPIDTSGDSIIQVAEAVAFTGYLNLVNANISDLTGLEEFTEITELMLNGNPINTGALDFTANTKLLKIWAQGISNINSIDVTQNLVLEELYISYITSLRDIDLTQNINLTRLSADGCFSLGSLTGVLDLSNNTSLVDINLDYTQIQLLDLSNNNQLTSLTIRGQGASGSLTSLNVKNTNNTNLVTFDTTNNPNLLNICVDDAIWATANLTNIDTQTIFTEICSNPNAVTGTITYDSDASGTCDLTDTKIANTRINTASPSFSNRAFSASDGTYTVYTNDTSTLTDITPNFSTSLFTVNPSTSVSSTFVGTGNTDVIDFCVTAILPLRDEVVVYSYTTAASRPGFVTKVRLFYKNNGSTTVSGTVTLNYNPNQVVYNTATVAPDPGATTANSYTWNYTNLLPFETRFIDVDFNINLPGGGANAVNSGDLISYTTTITPAVDVDSTNNSHIFTTVVVNAYDPNDILCFQGDKISIDQVPDELVYRIRFQNTGTASAVNVVVKTFLDAGLDIDTFTPISASHDYKVQLSNTNKVEFIFENIQLPDSTSDEPASHGWIFYKIKPLSSSVLGDDFDATANIYFDFNPPIITNTFNTEVAVETTITDSNFEMELINLNLDRGTPNTKVFTSNINTVTSLDVSNKNITDMTGIEDFTALTTLNVNANQLTTLDLSTNTLLTDLDVQTNLLTDLNVKNGNNTNFTQFTSIGNPDLTCIEVDDALWSTTNWTSIDATSNFVNDQAACALLSTETAYIEGFRLYPNPATSQINIHTTAASSIIMYDLLGKKILEENLVSGINSIDIKGITSGIYLIKYVVNNQSKTVKLIID